MHFHVPLHAAPGACTHLEMETYTWEVLPPALRLPIEDQLVREYAWTLDALARRGLASRELAEAAARA